MKDYSERYEQDARLTILKALGKEQSHSLNESILRDILEHFGFNRDRAWVRDQLKFMAGVDAVKTRQAGSVMIAILTSAGQNHLDRLNTIEGISRPSLEA